MFLSHTFKVLKRDMTSSTVIRFVTLSLLFFLSSSCTFCRFERKAHFNNNHTRHLSLPDTLIRYDNNSISTVRMRLDSTTVIVLVDSNDCQVCHLTNFEALTPLYEREKKDSTFRLYVVFSPPSKSIARFMMQVAMVSPQYTFYIDTTYTLMEVMPPDHILILNK